MEGAVLEVRTKRMKGEGTAPAECLHLVEGHGIEGDLHYDAEGTSKRQVLLLDRRTLDAEGYVPGVLREQILVDFEPLERLEPGTLLRVGTAVVEITTDCTPCSTMAGYVGEDPQAFVTRMMHRRGMLARVVQSGTVRAGDSVELCK
jgi:MOSC domain-containing protein YiiM